MKHKVLTLLLLLICSGMLFCEIPVSVGHFGKVNDLIYDTQRGLLFSAGEDGTVRIWNREDKLEGVVRISHRPVRQLAVHPNETQMAVLVGEGVQADTLEVWDWRRLRRMFTVETDKQLLHFAYSPKGSYLFYSQADYKSLTAVNPRTGRVLPYMGRGFGIVSYFTVAGNEDNVMTYQPSGSITYWNIRTGRMVKQVRAPADLELIRISPNNRYIAAATSQELLIVDILSGEVVDSSRVRGIVSLSFSPEGNEISGVVQDDDDRVLKKWYFGGKYLIEITTPYATSIPQANCVAHGERYRYAGTLEGNIAALVGGGEISEITKDKRQDVSDVAFFGSALAIATAAEIVIIDSEFFLGSYDQDRDVEVRELYFPNPYSCALGVTYLDAQRLLIWCKDEQEGKLAVLNTWYGGIREIPVDLGSAIRHVGVSEQGIVAVEQSGRCRVLDPNSFAVTFEYNAPGMNKLILTFADTLIGAKTQLSAFSGPLLQINRRTGETVPIQDPSLFVYDLYYGGGERGGQLYTLAVEQQAQKVRTVFKAHSGFAFERSRVLKAFDGEDLGATITGDESGGVFTSLGYGSVTEIRDSRVNVLEESGQIPRKLTAHNTKLFSLNRDSSISVWDISSREMMFNIHYLDDGRWIALSSSGSVLLSREVDLY